MEKVELQKPHFFAIITKPLDTLATRHIMLLASGLFDMPLAPGTYYYAYYSGMTAFTDSTNPHKGYSADGKAVS